MKRIKLTQGKYAKVDDDDFETLSLYKWHAIFQKGKWYARRNYIVKPATHRNNKFITVLMHRFILGSEKGIFVDHKDNDGLNNQRKNLRKCTNAENGYNRTKMNNNTSGFKGVSISRNKFVATVRVNKKPIYLGRFDKAKEAYKAYCEAAKKYHGDFANLG